MPLILEGIVTTLNDDDSPNVSPMGPIVDASMTQLTLRPFRTSRTYQNLKRTGQGVFHVVDDVLLLARAAVHRFDTPPAVAPAETVHGAVLQDACRWYEFEVVTLDDADERTTIETRVVHVGRLRDVFGFNRAKHAVLETAILATRLFLIPRTEVLAELDRLRIPVEKTAGPREREAFELLEQYIASYDDAQTSSAPTEPSP